MKALLIFCLFSIALALVLGCKEQAPNPAPNTGAAAEKKDASPPFTSTNDVAVIKTSAGDIVAEFWPEVAPGTVENFKKLARQGFYDGTASHRIMQSPTFGKMIRGEEMLAKLEATPCGPGNAGEMSRPTQRVSIESIRILPGNQVR